MFMIDEAYLENGSNNYFHNVRLLNKNKYNSMLVAYLPKQNIYLVTVTSLNNRVTFEYDTFRLVPIENCTCEKVCYLQKNKKRDKYGFNLHTEGFDAYIATDDRVKKLLENEWELQKEEKENKERK